MRFLFFLFGLPFMMMSFFEVSDVVPLASQANLIVDGTVIELSAEQQTEFGEKVCALFEGSRTLPAYGVALHNEFVEQVQDGTYVCLTYAMPMDVNGLKFDQLVFEISCDQTAFNIVRGNHGIFQGRCLFVDLGDGTMQELCDFFDGLELSSPSNEEDDSEQEFGQGDDENESYEQDGENSESGNETSGDNSEEGETADDEDSNEGDETEEGGFSDGSEEENDAFGDVVSY